MKDTDQNDFEIHKSFHSKFLVHIEEYEIKSMVGRSFSGVTRLDDNAVIVAGGQTRSAYGSATERLCQVTESARACSYYSSYYTVGTALRHLVAILDVDIWLLICGCASVSSRLF